MLFELGGAAEMGFVHIHSFHIHKAEEEIFPADGVHSSYKAFKSFSNSPKKWSSQYYLIIVLFRNDGGKESDLSIP